VSQAVVNEGHRGGRWLAEVVRRLPVRHGLQAVGLTDGPVLADAPSGGWNNEAFKASCQVFRQVRSSHVLTRLRLASLCLHHPTPLPLRSQSHFPMALMQCAMRVRLRDAEASVAADRKLILNYVAGRRGDALSAPSLDQCPEYEKFDECLVARFVAGNWRPLVEAGADMSHYAPSLGASSIARLALSFRGCQQCDDAMASLLAASLPRSLEELRTELVGSAATSEGGRALLDGLLERVERRALRVIGMHDCLLSGPVPPALAECTSLHTLDLAGNALSGAIPESLSCCVALRVLVMQNNQLSGPIPDGLGMCVRLERLKLNGNKLEGGVPAALSRCQALQELRLQKNPLLFGPLPSALGECVALVHLSVDDTLLLGLPDELRRRQESGALTLNFGQLSNANSHRW